MGSSCGELSQWAEKFLLTARDHPKSKLRGLGRDVGSALARWPSMGGDWGTMQLDRGRTPVRMAVQESTPTWRDTGYGEPEHGEMVTRHPSGSPSLMDLAISAAGRIEHLEQSGVHIAEAVIAIGGETGSRAIAARALLGRALMVHQEGAGSGEIVFQVEPNADRELRLEVLAIADALVSESGLSPVTITVRVGSKRYTRSAPA